MALSLGCDSGFRVAEYLEISHRLDGNGGWKCWEANEELGIGYYCWTKLSGETEYRYVSSWEYFSFYKNLERKIATEAKEEELSKRYDHSFWFSETFTNQIEVKE